MEKVSDKSLREIQDLLVVKRALYKENQKKVTLYYKRNRIEEKDHSVPIILGEENDDILREIHELFSQEQCFFQ